MKQRLRRWAVNGGVIVLTLTALVLGVIVMIWLQSLVFG